MICRVCMNAADISITGKIDNFQILSAIRNVANIVISHEDNLPKYICQNCLRDLTIALTFKQKCESSDYKLRLYSNQLCKQLTPMTYHDFPLILHQMERRKLARMKDQQKKIMMKIEMNKNIREQTVRKRRIRHHKCVPCDLIFISKEEMLEHRRKRSCVRRPCHTCGKLVLNLAMHTRLAHYSTHIYSCHVCGKTTKTAALLRSHLMVHSDKFKYQCPLCPYKGKQRAYLSLHMRTHTGERPYLCSQCSATFVNASNLKKHQLVHGSKEFECQECQKRFRCKKAQQEHYDAVHLKLRYQCKTCGRELWNRAKLLRHEIRMHNRPKHKLNEEVSKVIASEKYEKGYHEDIGVTQKGTNRTRTADQIEKFNLTQLLNIETFNK